VGNESENYKVMAAKVNVFGVLLIALFDVRFLKLCYLFSV
jgi:hypothetical protein